MRWRPPTPGQPIEPGPPLVPRTSPIAPQPEPPAPDAPSAPDPDAQAVDPESSSMSDTLADTEVPPDGPAGLRAEALRASTRPAWLGDPTLLDAFWRYERALMTNDIPELDALFAASPLTVRSEAGSALVGHDEIAAFRASRPPIPQRHLRRVHLRPIDENSAVIVAETVRNDNGTGSQTQLWQRADAESPWAVTVAHVSTVPGVQFGTRDLSRAEERSIWATPVERRPLVESQAYPASATGETPVGQLSGIRVAVKDLFAIAGETIGAGNPAFAAAGSPESTTAPAVQALIDAGAEITGLAQTDELAFSIAGTNVHYGTPPNPAAPGHISGGSTSGPASAVALGAADLALGTDTAGSIRVPGSYTGLFGLRTTHNAVSREGLVGLAPSFDTVGLLARDLSVLERGVAALLATGDRMPGAPFPSAAVSSAAAAPSPVASPAAPGHGASSAPAAPASWAHSASTTPGLADSARPAPPSADPATVAAPGDEAPLATADLDLSAPDESPITTAFPAPITRILVDLSLVALADLGAQLTFEAALRALALNSGLPLRHLAPAESLPAADLERWFDAFRLVQQYEAWAEDGAFVTAHRDSLDPAIAARFSAASTITDEAAEDARAILAQATSALEAAIPPGSALALPSTSSAAPALGADPAEIDRVRAATLRLTCLASLSGLPALTLPYGRVGTLPIGLCLIGSRASDLALLAAARPRG